MWEYRSRLSSKVNFVVFFTSIHFSGKMRLHESLVVESHLERVCVVPSLSFFSFSLSVILLYGISKRRTWEEQ